MTPTLHALDRRQTLRRLASASLAALLPTAWVAAASAAPAAAKPTVDVWKSPTCGCCGDWVTHMQSHGFTVRVHDEGNDAKRAELGIPIEHASCHTAVVGRYAIEGHVPAADIQRLLSERPNALGLAAPGMPIGSPGMDTPAYGGRRDPYQVLLMGRDGKAKVWNAYR